MTIIEVLPGYGVDRDGTVWCNRPINGKGNKTYPWRVVKPLICSAGRYLQVGIDKKKYLVHRLVALAFIGPCPDGFEVSHKNGISKVNSADNLEYKTHRENERMKIIHGTIPACEKNPQAKLTISSVASIRSRSVVGGRGVQAMLAVEHGVSQATISNIVNNKSW